MSTVDINTPFFTIVIPTYNRGHMIEETIKSVLRSRFKDYEIIIVDDGSTDNTKFVVKKYLNSFCSYYRKENEERAAARNYGVKIARGKYVNFLDSDDIIYENHLQSAYDFIVKNNEPEWFHLAYDYKTPSGKIISKNTLNEGAYNKLYYDNILSCCGTLVRLDIAKKYPFNEKRVLSSSEDWELWLRLNVNFKLQFSNTITNAVIAHDQRSLFTIESEKLIPRDLYLIECVENNQKLKERYGIGIRRFKADRYSFFMLKLAEENKIKQVYKWAFQAIITYPPVLFSKRFLASLKNTLV